jgi:DNA-binding phage protein
MSDCKIIINDMKYPEKDVEFVTDYIKGKFVEDVLAAMEQKKILKIDLAKRIGKSRQYVGRVLNETSNFSIQSMVEIALALNMTIEVKCES